MSIIITSVSSILSTLEIVRQGSQHARRVDMALIDVLMLFLDESATDLDTSFTYMPEKEGCTMVFCSAHR